MSIGWSEKVLRESGDPQDEAYANILAAIIDARGDVDFPAEQESIDPTLEPSQASGSSNWQLDEFDLPQEIGNVLLRSSQGLGGLSVAAAVEKFDTNYAIQSGAQKLIEPYSLAFRTLLPLTRSKSGKALNRGRPQQLHSVMNLERNGHFVEHTYNANYVDANGIVRLTDMLIGFGKSAGMGWGENRPELHFSYTDTEINTVSLTWGTETLLLPRLMPDQLQQFMLRAYGQGKQGSLSGTSVDYHTRNPSMLCFDLGDNPSLAMNSPRNIAVRYMADSEQTSQLTRQITAENIDVIKHSEMLPAAISAKQYLGLLHQVLQLVPTISDKEVLDH